MFAFGLNSFIFEKIGLKGLRSLQSILKGFSPAILFGLFLTGTFLEEVFYRGYLIERLITLTGNKWVAGFFSWFFFTFVHIKFFGLGPTLETGILSAALVIVYIKYRDIWPGIIIHGINDLVGFLLFPLFL
jgi:membrane protease YdiL (CAAX protease family)